MRAVLRSRRVRRPELWLLVELWLGPSTGRVVERVARRAGDGMTSSSEVGFDRPPSSLTAVGV